MTMLLTHAENMRINYI